jgi:hypothetical protein
MAGDRIVAIGPRRIVASRHRSSTLYQIHEHITAVGISTSETTMRPNPR